MTNFEIALNKLFLIEGGFSNDPTDRGGATRYGITEAVARANNYTSRMEDMSPEIAARIAKSQYWDILRLDEISRLSYPIAYELFDTGFNCGIGTAGKFLQRALNVLNRQATDYPDMTVDGVVGPLTVMALRQYLLKRGNQGEKRLLRLLNAFQGERYAEIAEKDPTQERFVYGWLDRVEVA